ncbi:MAG: O-antigen ligase family protein [Chloroflexi bacterium AL-W]|nr:O-antigen ligase family protein [Chloroflexi bacterium AL-N1]NOK68427.1 O-antigen ligase family protein [Chloroflexi bacterium AL-N10]NOK74073.1 O-antigen ligase family protein [Chloroflexi bacterium AL-N5]NOK83040.1 O-antigen ligase family protein [Chloroflexi bacterium AL-W]NOK90563.1 O-antigen ligase family protein [Chloroflexi bacterium AL-N15]
MNAQNTLLSRYMTPRLVPVIWLFVGVIGVGLGFVPLRPLVLAAGGLLAGLLPLIHPIFGLYLVVLSVPIQEVFVLPGGLSYTQAAMLLAIGGWGLHMLAHPERRIVTGPIFILWIALLTAFLLSAAFTPYSRMDAIRETMRWTVAFVVWFITVNTVTKPWHLFGLLACLLCAPAAEAIIGLFQFVAGSGPPSFRISGTDFARAYGTIGTPNAFAGYLNMGWPLAFALALGMTWYIIRGQRHSLSTIANDHDRRRLISGRWLLIAGLWFATGLLGAALLASFSRGGWLGAAVGGVAMTVVIGRWTWRRVLAALAVLVVVLVVVQAGVLPTALTERLTSITRSVAFFDPQTVEVTPDNFAVVERTAQLWAGWQMFVTHPLTGVGAGNFNNAYPAVTTPPWYASRGHAHNYYLHIAGEVGSLGIIAYLTLIIGVSYQTIRTLQHSVHLFQRSIMVGCWGVIAAVAGHSMFENLHALNMGIQLAVIWALSSVLSRDPNLTS